MYIGFYKNHVDKNSECESYGQRTLALIMEVVSRYRKVTMRYLLKALTAQFSDKERGHRSYLENDSI